GRANLPGTMVQGLAADPGGRWVAVVAGSDYGAFDLCRLPADLADPAAVLPFPALGVMHSWQPAVSRDGSTVTILTDDQRGTTWLDVDAADWKVRRKETGADRRYSPAAWVRLDGRT